MNAGLLQQKKVLRAVMRQQLNAHDAAGREAGSLRIVRRIAEAPAWREASRVLIFAPMPVEPDLDLLWRDGALADKQAAYPRVVGDTLRLYYIDGLDELEPTHWGLREPPPRAAREAALEEIGVVLVPGLAFDAAGGRLGRGKGFYDRLLAGRNPAITRLVGVGFAFQEIEGTLPLAPHDVRVDEFCSDVD